MDYLSLCRLDILVVLVLAVASQRIPNDTTNPFIIEHPEDQYVVKNEPATLNCKAGGVPAPVITWYRNGQQVVTANEDSSSHRMLLPGGQLILIPAVHSKTGKSDFGVYYCNATNPETRFSVVSRNATLDIAVIRDEFREIPQTREVAVGMETTLTCRPPKGDPEPEVKWKKNGRQISVTGDHRMNVDDGGSLHMRAVQKEDGGSYVCVAFNVAGERESPPARLLVREKPRIINGPQDVVVKETSDVTFECKVVGDPLPTVLWKKQEGAITSERSEIMNDRSLRLERVQLSDEGVYVCRTENSVGYQEAEARLTVHSVPRFLKTPRNMTVGVGRHVSFFCEVEGNPIPTLFWNKESSQIFLFSNGDHDRFLVTEDGRLIIKSVQLEDSGQYKCQALNKAGTAFANATLTVTASDSRLPPIIQHGPQNQTLPIEGRAVLYCSATGNPLPRILWTKNGKVLPRGDARISFIDGSTLQISDLRRSDAGLYTCEALSEAGQTTWSATVSVEDTTDPAIVFNRSPQLSAFPGPPTKLTVSDITETSMQVSWRLNANAGASPVSSYLLEYFSPDTGEGWAVVADYVRETSMTISNLRPNTQYVFLVRARNSHGLGPPSQPSAPGKTLGNGVIIPATDLPVLDLHLVSQRLSAQIITNLLVTALSSTALNVTWATSSRNLDFIEGFYIKYRPVDDPVGARSSQREEYIIDAIHSNSAAQFIITHLQKFTWYDVSVQPFYRTIKGVTSNTVRTQTLEDVPSAAPLNIQVLMVDNVTLQVSWTRPPANEIHGQLLGYKIYVYGNEMRLIREIRVNSSMEAISIYNLVKNSKYSVQMSAVNRIGEGLKSEAISANEQRLVNEPWFLATLIGTIGGVLWVSLCLFIVILYRKHRAHKTLNRNSAGSNNSKSHDNHQLNPLQKELPYALGHQLVTSSSSSIKPCACNQALVSSCCYNESLSDGEYKANGEQLSASHTYYTLETPTPQINSNPNAVGQVPPNFSAKAYPLIAPYATATATGSCCPDNHADTPDGVFRPIPGVNCDERETWNNETDPHQSYSSCEEGPDHGTAGHPMNAKQPVLYLPPPPSQPPSEADSASLSQSWSAAKIQPPVYNISAPRSHGAKIHGKVMPLPHEKVLLQQKVARNYVTKDEVQVPRYVANQQPLPHSGFQASDYAIKLDNRRQQCQENSTDSDNFSAGYYTFIKPS